MAEFNLRARQHLAGFHQEALQFIHDMVRSGEPVGAMGNDTAPAILSDHRRPLTDFKKQNFAQITNPAIHPYTEQDVTSLATHLGSHYNIDGQDSNQEVTVLPSPIITKATFEAIREKFHPVEIDCTFPYPGTFEDFQQRKEEIKEQALEAARQGRHIILTNEGAGANKIPFEMDMIGSAVHLHLVKNKLRDQTILHARAMEAHTTHDIACLIGDGLDTVNPLLAEETIAAAWAAGEYGNIPFNECFNRYFKSADFGLLTIMNKMGICSSDSYRGAFQFEALGLGPKYIEEFAPGMPSAIGGWELEDFYKRAVRFHEEALEAIQDNRRLPHRGIHSVNQGPDAENHAISGVHIQMLQEAVQAEGLSFEQRLEKFMAYAASKREFNASHPTQIRDLWDIRYKKDPKDVTEADLEGVESAQSIIAKLGVASMSYGSTSPEQYNDLFEGARRAGAKWMAGEGGVPKNLRPITFAGKGIQIASGRFGIDIEVVAHADEIEIKIGQAAKGGEGGQLPGKKVNEEIAEARNCMPGTDLYSMAAHASIKSIEDLAQLIYGLKEANPNARVAVKVVAAAGIDTIIMGAIKDLADRVHICGTSGGTGASKKTSQQHTSMPWEIYLPVTHRTLTKHGYRERASVSFDGGVSTPQDVAIGAMLGAEEAYFGKLLMYVVGCRNMGVCNENICAFGNASMDKELRKNYKGKVEYVENFFHLMAEGIRRELAALGVKSLDELRGRADLISHTRKTDRNLDFSNQLATFEGNNKKSQLKPGQRNEYIDPQSPNALSLDEKIYREHRTEILDGLGWESPVIKVTNLDRNIGTRLSYYLTREFRNAARPDNLIKLNLEGDAGQMLGFLLARGITIDLRGGANDGVAEGNSGGIVVVRPQPGSRIARESHEHAIAGNHAQYGMTAGEVYLAGRAANNHAYRLSGGRSVNEGVGSNAFRFVTGGETLTLGEFGPGMFSKASGGTHIIYDPNDVLPVMIDQTMKKEIRRLEDMPQTQALAFDMLKRHAELTDSQRGQRFLDRWGPDLVSKFKVVAPAYGREQTPVTQPSGLVSLPVLDVRR